MAKKRGSARPKGGKGGKKGSTAKRAAFKAPISTKTGKAADSNPIPVTKVTPGSTLKSLLSTCRGLKQNADGIIGKMREEIAFAVGKKNLQKGPFADLRKFDKMEAEKASEHWHTLVRYMELSGVMAKIEAVGRLPLGDDAEGEEEAETGEEAGETEQPQAAAAGAKASKAKSKAKNGEANGGGIKPAGETDNVSRPLFGSKEHADMLAQQGKLPGADATESAGKPH